MRIFRASPPSLTIWALVAVIAVLGWELHQASVAFSSKDAEVRFLRSQLTLAEQARTRVLAKLQTRHIPRTAKAVAATALPVRTSAAQTEIETWQWLKGRHLSLHISPIGHFDGRPEIDSNLALMLGLTPGEFDRLNAAIQKTYRKFDELAIQRATSRVSADGKTLTVSVPSLAQQGNSLYTGLLQTFENVLGPQRFQLFNAVAGDAFDNSFNSFGVDPVTYVLTLQPAGNGGGTPQYSVTSSYRQASPSGVGWRSGSLSLASLDKEYPVLAHFLPPNLDSEASSGSAGQ